MYTQRDRGLFASVAFHDFQEGVWRLIKSEVDGFDANWLLNSSPDDLVAYFEEKYRREPPRLLEERVEISDEEVSIDVSRYPDRIIWDRSRPFLVKGLAVTFHIPFEGDPECFTIQPGQHLMTLFRGTIKGHELQVRMQGDNLTPEYLRGQFDSVLGQYRQELGFLRTSLIAFNAQIGNVARDAVAGRRAKLLQDRSLTASLGLPIRARPDAPKNYPAPEARRKINPTLPAASSAPFKPEPTLPTESYEHILRIIGSLAQVMERSPHAFRTMDEETLRTHILVQLNGHFEGAATAETFNYEGKTDILIRSDNRNVFIAECKFWSGPEGLTKTIKQLLGYTAWRDTKAAIIIFNRNKDFSSVLAKLDETVKRHSGFKRELRRPSETAWRYVFGHRDDASRELILTVLAFDIPGAE